MEAEHFHLEHAGWISFPPNDLVLQYLREGWFEYRERAFMCVFLRPGDTFLDIGSHVGVHACAAKSLVGETGRVVCVEPNATILPYLETNLEVDNDKRRILNFALSDHDGEQAFVSPGNDKAAYAHLAESLADDSTIVRTRTFDSLVSSLQGHADLVKVDIEGSEYQLFKNSPSALSTSESAFIVEMAKENLERSGSSTEELENLIRQAGFQITSYDLESNALQRLDLQHPVWYQNLIVCRDPDAVNRRLGEASADRKRIATDIFRKGASAASLYDASEKLRREEAVIRDANGSLAELCAHMTSGGLAERGSRSSRIQWQSQDPLSDLQNLLGQCRAIAEHTVRRLDGVGRDVEQSRLRLSVAQQENAKLAQSLDEERQAKTELQDLCRRLQTDLEGWITEAERQRMAHEQVNRQHSSTIAAAMRLVMEMRRSRLLRLSDRLNLKISQRLTDLVGLLSQ